MSAQRCLSDAGCRYRWHDIRHTFVSHLAENPAVSDQTIMALAGHVSKQMPEHYSHIRTQAKQDAIAAMWAARQPTLKALAQDPAQSPSADRSEGDSRTQ
jgi:integrase